MRKIRLSEEQKVKMVRETEQSSVAEVAKKHGVSVETLYRWRRAYGGMELPEVKRLRQLEQENARLKIRCMRQWTKAQVTHRGRRVDARSARHRCGQEHSLEPRHRNPRPARRAEGAPLGQRA